MNLDKLRADFVLVRAWLVKYEELTQEQGVELGAGIAEAVKSGDTGELAFWTEWMDRYAEMARAHEAQMREIDAAAARWWADQQRRAA